jgi:hypothetical protein
MIGTITQQNLLIAKFQGLTLCHINTKTVANDLLAL